MKLVDGGSLVSAYGGLMMSLSRIPSAMRFTVDYGRRLCSGMIRLGIAGSLKELVSVLAMIRAGLPEYVDHDGLPASRPPSVFMKPLMVFDDGLLRRR